MSSKENAKTLRRLRKELLASVKQLEYRLDCVWCPIPQEIIRTADILVSYCIDRCEDARIELQRVRNFGGRFFHWLKDLGWGINKVADSQRLLLDCQEWVDVVLHILTFL
jgi:hypothetical protein